MYLCVLQFTGLPTVEEVCSFFDLVDVDIVFTDEDCQILTTYKLFQQHVQPILQKGNPEVQISEIMMLVAAKWREFSESNPNLQEKNREKDESPPKSPVYIPKPSRSRSSKSSAAVAKAVPAKSQDDYEEKENDDDEPEVKSKRSKSKRIFTIFLFENSLVIPSQCKLIRKRS